MSPRVVHIITDLDEGGAEASLYRLCSHCSPGTQRVICLMDSGKYGPLLRQAGVAVDCLGLTRGQFNAAAVLRLWRLLRRFKPDLVQTWMYHSDLLGGLTARLAGIRRVVWGVRTSRLDAALARRSTLLVIRICALLSRLVPDRILCCAERAKQEHQRLGYPADRFVVIPNGIDLNVFKPDVEAGLRFRAQVGLPLDGPLLGTVARFDPQKDQRTLIEALSLLRAQGFSLHCLMVGPGMVSSNQQLQAWLQELGVVDQVYLLGSHTGVPAVMNALTFHVLSSAVEAFPNVLVEAMACGVPCIATDVGDSALILGGSGWVVPPRNPLALAKALATALREPVSNYQQRRHEACEQIAARYSISSMVDGYTNLYASLT